MKNNILLILAVTIISIGIIVATVLISSAGGTESSKPDSSSQQGTSGSTQGISAPADPTEEANTPPSTSTTSSSKSESSLPPAETDNSSQPYDSEAADAIISTAHSLIGIDFADDGASPDYGFDNSGFIYYVLRENGYITCPRGLNAQAQMGTSIAYEALRPGDLAFFYAEDMATVGFGGIYCGDGIMLACLMPGTQVKEVDITTPYYRNHFCKGISLT